MLVLPTLPPSLSYNIITIAITEAGSYDVQLEACNVPYTLLTGYALHLHPRSTTPLRAKTRSRGIVVEFYDIPGRAM